MTKDHDDPPNLADKPAGFSVVPFKPKARAKSAGNGHAAKAAPVLNGAAGIWYARLICSKSGNPVDCIENVRLVLLGDPAFAGLIHYDELRERVVVGSLPWHSTERLRDWVDRDD